MLPMGRPPVLTENKISELLLKHYGLHLVNNGTKELTAYDDRNYLVKCRNNSNNEVEYVFKVTNAKDTIEKIHLMQYQVQLLKYLTLEGFKVPESIMALSNNGSCVVVVEIEQGMRHAVRLFKYIKGDIWANVSKKCSNVESLYKSVGAYCAKLIVSMQKFTTTTNSCGMKEEEEFVDLRNYSCEWHLDNPTVKKITNNEFAKIFQDFDECVVAKRDSFEIGLVHSDLNDNNIIINANDDTVAGVIDFNEVTVAPLIYDLAILITDAMCHSVVAGKYVLEGYLAHKQVPQGELNVLTYCVRMRVCQCLVLMQNASKSDPNNAYLTESLGKLQQLLHTIADKDIFELWIH